MCLIQFTLFLRQANRQLQKDPTTEIQQLQEELIACKLREAEANLSMKELRQRVADLDKYWQVSTRLRAHSHPAKANAKRFLGSFPLLFVNRKLNKKVLLRSRKRQTARCVASTRYAALSNPDLVG